MIEYIVGNLKNKRNFMIAQAFYKNLLSTLIINQNFHQFTQFYEENFLN